jgi:hypothetical protein
MRIKNIVRVAMLVGLVKLVDVRSTVPFGILNALRISIMFFVVCVLLSVQKVILIQELDVLNRVIVEEQELYHLYILDTILRYS